ncbi:FHA domain-containing protein [Paramicrobacterium agarici]|uniref:FHA domain-containing protein n=1 Tax=Paramicrobacterium agarici TaxID=630514 RepID=UPI001167A80F|nr:FHA domain-containing protein [Microbacterium agarici]TQO22058.1 FHA domain-containing protein [Microbacterium agarici]
MTQFSYTAAHQREWIALAASGRLLVVRIDDDAELLTRVTNLDIGALTIHDTLDALTAGGLASTPAFGLCFWVAGTLSVDGVGVIVYGDTEVTVGTDAGDVTVRATGVSGWGEQLVEGASRIELLDGADTAAALPLSHGAAWVAGVSLRVDGAVADAGAAARTEQQDAETAAESQHENPVPIAREPASEPKPDTVAIEKPSAAAPPPAPSAAEAEPKPDTAEQPVWAEPSAPESVSEDTEVPEMTLLPGDVAGPIELPEPDEQTIMRTPGQPVVPPRDEPLGDHDGMTVLAEDVRAARNAAHLPEGAAAAPQDVPQYAYALELPGGGRQQLDAPVVLGRAPSVSNVPASVLPHLVTLAGDDISRTHVRVAVEGDAVVVTDLHSSNGTVIDAPGRAPQQLRGGEPVPVIAGTVIDLGSGVKLRVLEA